MAENKRDLTLDELCQQSIQNYLDIRKIGYEQQGAYLRLKDHDSLVVDTRITPGKKCETFYWNSQGVGGNLFNFLVSYEGMDKHQAIEQLKQLSPELVNHKPRVVKTKPFSSRDWPASQQTQAVSNYLTKTRKLDPRLVQLLLKQGLVRQLKNGNAFFSWRDKNGKEVGGDVQGTVINHEKYGKRGTIKRIARGSQKNLGFHFNMHDPKGDNSISKLYVFESPIDALSYFQMHGAKQRGNKSFISLNGAGSKVKTIVQFMKQNGFPNELHLAFDTDEAGVKGAEKANELITNLGQAYKVFNEMKVVVDQPDASNKDWNEALQKGDYRLIQQDYFSFEAGQAFRQQSPQQQPLQQQRPTQPRRQVAHGR